MVLTEICPKDAQGSFVSNAELDQNPVSKPEKGSDCYSVIDHEVCVMKFISSAWWGIGWRPLVHILKKSKKKSKERLWTKNAKHLSESGNWTAFIPTVSLAWELYYLDASYEQQRG